MVRGKMSQESILDSIQLLLKQSLITGEKLNASVIARRIGCSRTTLYTNHDVRELLLGAGIIDDTTPIKKNVSVKVEVPEKGSYAFERRLKKAEERANRLEILLSEANEKIMILEAETERLRFKIRLLSEGKSLL